MVISDTIKMTIDNKPIRFIEVDNLNHCLFVVKIYFQEYQIGIREENNIFEITLIEK